MTSLSAEKPHDMIIGRAKRGQISRTDSEFFNGIGQERKFSGSNRLSKADSDSPLRGATAATIKPVRGNHEPDAEQIVTGSVRAARR